MKKSKQLNVRISNKMFKAVTAKGATQFKEISVIVRELLGKWLKKA